MRKNLFLLLLICSVSLSAFADLREGALPGEFYVSPTKKVHFSSGNFQSCRNGNRLAEHQYDFIGASNRKISSSWSYNGYFDLFGWGQSYWTYSAEFSDYADYTEWGEYPLSNADNNANWRTLTTEEWKYLLCNSPENVGFGTVAEKTGLILIPDELKTYLDKPETTLSFRSINKEGQMSTLTDGGNYGFSINKTKFTDNVYNVEQWDTLETLGAVFLPAAYYRTKASNDATEVSSVLYESDGCGYYWSSNPVENSSEKAYAAHFNVYYGTAYVHGVLPRDRYIGMSIRLVTENAEYNPVMELDPIKVDTDGDAEISFNYSGPSSSSVLQTTQKDDYYDDVNSCLALCTPLQDSYVKNLMDEVQQAISDFTSKFSGISFFLPAGKGELKLDICTHGLQLSVHIGNAVAHLTQNERGEAVIQYNIPEPTLVCMHAIEIEVNSAPGRHARKQVTDEKKRVELYKMKIVPDKNATAIEDVQIDKVQCTKIMENGALYILHNGTKYNVQGQARRPSGSHEDRRVPVLR